LPKDAFWGSGAGHQVVLVVPSLKLMAVRNGQALAEISSSAGFNSPIYEWLFEPLIEAVRDRNPPAGAAAR
jgi:hypothetical protein